VILRGHRNVASYLYNKCSQLIVSMLANHWIICSQSEKNCLWRFKNTVFNVRKKIVSGATSEEKCEMDRQLFSQWTHSSIYRLSGPDKKTSNQQFPRIGSLTQWFPNNGSRTTGGPRRIGRGRGAFWKYSLTLHGFSSNNQSLNFNTDMVCNDPHNQDNWEKNTRHGRWYLKFS